MTRPGRRRPSFGLIKAALLIAPVVACQPLPQPFADDRPPAALMAVPHSIDIAVGTIEGEPRATADKLQGAMAKELVTHNIPATDQTPSKASYRLDGRIEAKPGKPGQSQITVFWRLRDPRGNIVNERSDKLAASTHDWETGNEAPVGQLAASSAASLAAIVGDDPPKDQASSSQQPGGGQPVDKGRIRVAVRKVSGAPGDGNSSLVTSLTAVLKHRDIDLVDIDKGKPDLAVDGDVKLDPAQDGKQHIKIVWHVARPGGGEIGQVAQENDIPRGQLDRAWGDVAYSVAMAAEGGIMQLVDRGAPPQKLRAETAAMPRTPPPVPDGVGLPPAPASPSVAGNIDSPAVNLPPVDVKPQPDAMPTPLPPPDVPVLLPYRGVPIPR